MKSGLTNDDLIRLCDLTRASDAVLDRMPRYPSSLDDIAFCLERSERLERWRENSDEYQSWKREYDLACSKECAAYLRLRWQIGRRIGAHLIGIPKHWAPVHVFPRSQFPSRASVNKYWIVLGTESLTTHREEFPAGIAVIYTLPDGLPS